MKYLLKIYNIISFFKTSEVSDALLTTATCQWRSNGVGKVQGAHECRGPRVPGKKIKNKKIIFPLQ